MTQPACTHHKTSLISGQDLVPVLDFGMHACADSFVGVHQLHLSEPSFPLTCGLDTLTGYLQLTNVTDDSHRYTLYDYSYTSANNIPAQRHWHELADWIMRNCNIASRPVVEVGSNDGYLLELLQNRGVQVIGIDPSPGMIELARARGLECLPTMWNETSAAEVVHRKGKVAAVISNNVLNHANDPVAFANTVKSALFRGGYWVFEVPYLLDLVQGQRFDQIYHEHVSYFTVSSLKHLLESAGFGIVAIDRINYHGGSLRVAAQLGRPHNAVLNQMIQAERAAGLFSPDAYRAWYQQLVMRRNQWMQKFYERINERPEVPVIGVGAAAKANTALTWYGLDSSLIHSITDASPLKQGKFTPLTRIPIRHDEEFANHPSATALLLTWNLSAHLMKTVSNINSNVDFLSL
jgi:SAM-dependent methyltransferase